VAVRQSSSAILQDTVRRQRIYHAGRAVFLPDAKIIGAIDLALDGLAEAEHARQILAACEAMMRLPTAHKDFRLVEILYFNIGTAVDMANLNGFRACLSAAQTAFHPNVNDAPISRGSTDRGVQLTACHQHVDGAVWQEALGPTDQMRMRRNAIMRLWPRAFQRVDELRNYGLRPQFHLARCVVLHRFQAFLISQAMGRTRDVDIGLERRQSGVEKLRADRARLQHRDEDPAAGQFQSQCV
jgi:hypothetical protein